MRVNQVFDRADEIGGLLVSVVSQFTVLEDRGFVFVRRLGEGQEGAVYAVRSPTGQILVAKLFHERIVREVNIGAFAGKQKRAVPPAAPRLRAYANGIRTLTEGLYPISLVENDSQLIGLLYPFEPLYQVRGVLLNLPVVRLAFLGAFCRAQAWLLSYLRLGITEPQFMIAHDGTLRYIDYGPMLVPLDDFRCQEDHYLDLTLFRLLYGLFKQPEVEQVSDIPFTSMDMPSPYAQPNWLQEVSRASPSLYEVLCSIAPQPASIFLDPSPYMQIARVTPKRLPGWLTAAARLMHGPVSTKKPD